MSQADLSAPPPEADPAARSVQEASIALAKSLSRGSQAALRSSQSNLAAPPPAAGESTANLGAPPPAAPQQSALGSQRTPSAVGGMTAARAQSTQSLKQSLARVPTNKSLTHQRSQPVLTPQEDPPAAQPSMSRIGSAAALPPPVPASISRQGSQVSTGAAAAAAQRQASAAALSRHASHVSQSGAALNKVGSATALGATTSQAALAVSQSGEEAAAALYRSLSQKSQSAARLSHHGSQVALSRQGTAQRSQSQLVRGGSAALIAAEPAAPPPAEDTLFTPVEDDGGVDWRLTSKHHQDRAAALEAENAQLRADLKKAEQRAADAEKAASASFSGGSRRGSNSAQVQMLQQENDRLRAAAEAASANTGVSPREAAMEVELDQLRQQLHEAKLSTAGRTSSTREVVREVVKEVVPPNVQALLERATQEVEGHRKLAEERDAQLQNLAGQLEQAHSAIIAATHTGFEHDIKLHQARAALSALLKRERASPRRSQPPRSAPPAEASSWQQYPSIQESVTSLQPQQVFASPRIGLVGPGVTGYHCGTYPMTTPGLLQTPAQGTALS